MAEIDKPAQPATAARATKKRGGINKTGRNSAEHNPTPRQRELQAKAFLMSVEGRTTRSIGAELKISENTAASYIRIEERRRKAELDKSRDTATARSVNTYERIKERALKRADTCDAILNGIKSGTLDARVSDHSLGEAIKAQERIDRIQGVDAPTKVNLGLKSLLDALNGQ